ncbi:hypothetical protein AALP_AA3G158600 [Arabis alpina]|uniref:DNA N(6)-methyladenine demethylase n=1 Tax=Arabis alpina TaxID=50452 RepID=A0A087H9H1_ARAAL|nr:hypothetical protein AALP_AA3G158600 [Arabis alpina]
MNRGEDGHSGSRGRSPASGHGGYRWKSETPVGVDRSLNESFGNRSSGSRGRVSGRASWSRHNSSGYANYEHRPVQAYVEKPLQVSNVGFVEKRAQNDGLGSTKQPVEVAASKFCGDDKDLVKLSASSSSKKYMNLSGGSVVSRECEDKDGARMRCDLVNRVKDVSLSCKDSVFSTSGQKVDHSSVVVDHGSAHKSGDGGNSSIESSTGLFDIFLEKTVMGVKPSLLEINREKRKASKGYTGIVIRPGMVLLKNYLSINDQVMIVNKCRQLGLGEGGFYQPGYRDGAILHLKMMCLGKNWDPETSQYGETRPVDGSIPPKIPVEFSQFVEKAVKESQSLVATTSKNMKAEDEIPSMSPDICIANFYTTTGRLGLHQDKDESRNSIQKGLPVVSFSIGDSAEFLYSDQWEDEKAEKVLLESGDVLIFGGKSRNVFHGVRSIVKDTAPKVLVQETSLRQGRLNLTFRQY